MCLLWEWHMRSWARRTWRTSWGSQVSAVSPRDRIHERSGLVTDAFALWDTQQPALLFETFSCLKGTELVLLEVRTNFVLLKRWTKLGLFHILTMYFVFKIYNFVPMIFLTLVLFDSWQENKLKWTLSLFSLQMTQLLRSAMTAEALFLS